MHPVKECLTCHIDRTAARIYVRQRTMSLSTLLLLNRDALFLFLHHLPLAVD